MIHLIIYRLELSGSFYSWRGAIWIITAASIFSLVAYLLLTDKELSLLDQGEMLFTFSEVIIVLGLLMSGINSSSSISTEIEGGTFECLLLTPIKHIQLATQKMLSTVTIWIILYLVSIPYLIVLANGTNLAIPSILYVGLYGTVLSIAISMISIALSWILKNSKNSIMVTIMIILLLCAPSLFFGTSLRRTDFGVMLENINPFSHAINSLDSVLVDNQQAFYEQLPHVWPILVFAIVCSVIFVTTTKKFEVSKY